MNIYLLTRTDEIDYDEYDAFVIAAPGPQSALALKRPKLSATSSEWAQDKDIKVELIGTTTLYTKPTEILGSYNAG